MIPCRRLHPDSGSLHLDSESLHLDSESLHLDSGSDSDTDDSCSEHDSKPANLNPWKRNLAPYPARTNYFAKTINPSRCQFNAYDVNTGPHVYTKMAILKVSPSVVALISYSGGKQAFWGSGVIFGSFWKHDSLYYSVLTSATLLKPPLSHGRDNGFELLHNDYSAEEPEDEDFLPIDEKIDVYLKGGNLCEGTVVTYDPHYNIAVLTFKSDSRLQCAVLRPLDDSLALNNEPINAQSSVFRHPHLPIKLISGDVVIAVGRYPMNQFEIMEAPGKYSADSFDKNIKLNCMELFWAHCKITKCGIGGPLINCSGEVIGINFYVEHCTPFLPINIFLKWWSHYKVTRSHCRPSLGMKVANLHTADLGTLDQVRKLGISEGLIVEKVLSGSPAEICGLLSGDVVFKCCDTVVVSPLQFFEIIWGMVGQAVDVVVVREGYYKNMKIDVKDITSADEFYQWLLPKAYIVYL